MKRRDRKTDPQQRWFSPPPFGIESVRPKVAELMETILGTVGFAMVHPAPGLRDTPMRFAKAFEEYLAGYEMDLQEILKSTFPGDGYGTYDEMIVQRDIPFYSMCEHHLAPFAGVAHVGYIPSKDGPIIGLSKMARLVDFYARRLQVQERLTVQVADTMMKHLKPRGVGVMVEATHLCIAMRGIRKPNTVTVTSALKGAFRHSGVRAEFFNLVRGR